MIKMKIPNSKVQDLIAKIRQFSSKIKAGDIILHRAKQVRSKWMFNLVEDSNENVSQDLYQANSKIFNYTEIFHLQFRTCKEDDINIQIEPEKERPVLVKFNQDELDERRKYYEDKIRLAEECDLDHKISNLMAKKMDRVWKFAKCAALDDIDDDY